MSIRDSIERILNEWPREIQRPFKDNALANFIRRDFLNDVYLVSSAVNKSLMIKSSSGAGTWASVPWLALLDPRITTTTQNGIYPVYLFRADGTGVYLSLGQGATKPNKELGRSGGENRARSIARKLRISIPELSEWTEGKIDLRSDTDLGKSYEIPNIGARLYEKETLPSDEVFQADLLELLSVYAEVIDQWPKISATPENLQKMSPLVGNDIKVIKEGSVLNIIGAFKVDLQRAGLVFSEVMPVSICAALSSKPFLILTGLSGSGKTQLAQAFSTWICASERQLELIAVGADWTSNDNLLGYPDALKSNSYRKPDNGALDLILRAQANPDLPHFLILDEMNLSHVERYFADFLSAMESGEPINLHDDTGADWDGVPSKLKIPKNLFVIGTVNVDETTYMFSPKVLDRANVIEFRVSDEEMNSFLENPVKPDLDAIVGQGVQYAKAFVAAAKQRDVPLDAETREKVSAVLMEFFPELKKAGAEFGYRTAHEIFRFVYFHKELSNEWKFETAMDAAIMQKLLPKLHGSKRKLGPVLATLIRLCLNAEDCPESDPIKDEVLIKGNALYPEALEKLARMRKRLTEHGFTSFAEA